MGFDKRYSERVPRCLEPEMQDFQRHGYISAAVMQEYQHLDSARTALVLDLGARPSKADADRFVQSAASLVESLRAARAA